MKAQRLEFIDGLRGLAALLILVYHAWGFSGAPWNVVWNPLASGYVGVHLFLVISGFCIYWPFANGRSMSLREFGWRRFRRIAPPYYAAFALFGVVALLCAHFSWVWPETPRVSLRGLAKTTVTHALFLHNLLPNHILAVAGPFWSIGLEMQLYLAMPLLAAAAARWGIRTAVVIAALATFGYRAGVSIYVGGPASFAAGELSVAYVVNYSFLGRWVEFALGMWAAVLVARARFSPKSSALLGAGSLLFFVAAIASTAAWGKFNVLADPLFGAAFFLTLLTAAAGAHVGRSPFARVLCWKPLCGLGLISYSLYLLHSPIIRWMIELARPFVSEPVQLFLLTIIIGAPLIVGLSFVFFLVFEKPFLNAPKKQNRPPAARAQLQPVPAS
jgi:peptidoglycan/LPS O-acetylase OafA/YrhL